MRLAFKYDILNLLEEGKKISVVARKFETNVNQPRNKISKTNTKFKVAQRNFDDMNNIIKNVSWPS